MRFLLYVGLKMQNHVLEELFTVGSSVLYRSNGERERLERAIRQAKSGRSVMRICQRDGKRLGSERSGPTNL